MRVAVNVVYALNVVVLVSLFFLGLIGKVYLILMLIAMILIAVLRIVFPRNYEKVTDLANLLSDLGTVIGIDFIGIYLQTHSQTATYVAAAALIVSLVFRIRSGKISRTRNPGT